MNRDQRPNNNLEKSMVMLKQMVTEKQGSYILNQKIGLSESYKLEYKNYHWPFDQKIEFILMKTISSFLNRSGGTILIGVNDAQIVKGIQIKNVDDVKLYFDKLKKSFYPLPQGLIKTVELPIKRYFGENQEKYQWLSNTYILRIEVSQGILDKLYTFKHYEGNREKIFCSYREDASVETTSSFDKIYDKIYQKSRQPENRAEMIAYEEPNYQGFNESLLVEQPIQHKIQHSYIAFTNIREGQIDRFRKFLKTNLFNHNLLDFEYEPISEFITILKSPKLAEIMKALKEIVAKEGKEVSAFTDQERPLKFGYLKSVLTFKNLNQQDSNLIQQFLQELNFSYKVKDNGDMVISTSQNMNAVPAFYSNCKFENFQIFLDYE